MNRRFARTVIFAPSHSGVGAVFGDEPKSYTWLWALGALAVGVAVGVVWTRSTLTDDQREDLEDARRDRERHRMEDARFTGDPYEPDPIPTGEELTLEEISVLRQIEQSREEDAAFAALMAARYKK